jgi:tetratricopeptide (TPR) repeat protein
MRAARGYTAALLLVAANAVVWAHADTNPYDAGIRTQETVVARGNGDGKAWLTLAILCQDAARYDESEGAYRKAIALLKNGDREMLAEALDHMGTMYVETGRFTKAEPLEQRALSIREELGVKGAIGTSYTHLAALEFGKKDLGLAETDAEMAVSLLAPAHADEAHSSSATPEQQMSALIDLSLVRCARGECTKATPELERALAIAHAHYGANSVPVGFLDFLVGYSHWKSGDSAPAAEAMKRGTEELGTQLGWGHPTYIAALRQYEVFLTQANRSGEAAGVAARIEQIESAHRDAGGRGQQAALLLNQLP